MSLNSLILYGSATSPYVRKIRMLLLAANIPFEMKAINTMDPKDSAALTLINPIHKIPTLVDGETVVWDSRVIQRYLAQKYNLAALTWPQENLLSAIDGALDTAINLFYVQRSGIDLALPNSFFDHQQNRLENILDYLQKHLEDPDLQQWNFVSSSLCAFWEWAIFRNRADIKRWPEHEAWLSMWATQPQLIATKIPPQ